MDADELLPRRKDDPLTLLRTQDLDPLSVDELKERILILEAELERTRAKMDGARQFRSAADALFTKR